MRLDLTRVRLIVYDLDGTVYDDNRHFEIYARLIQEYLPEAQREHFWHDYTAVREGRHPALRVGTFYDIARDMVLQTKAGKVLRALHWDGSEAPPEARRQLYPKIVEPDQTSIINVGDLWWVPSAVSLHHGGNRENHGKAFMRVREIMSADSFTMSPIPGLQETIAGLRAKRIQVLATNSPQPDSEAILTKVGLLGLFDAVYFRSNKPMGLKAIFLELAERYGLAMDQILSVGDNLVNEIAPARAMGCQTVFIDPFGLGEEDDADLRVSSMSDLIPLLRQVS